MKPTIIYRQTALRFLAGLILLCLPALPAAAGQVATPDKWDGETIATQLTKSSSSDTILIATAAELAYFAQQVNNSQAIQLGNEDSIKPDSINKNGAGFSGFTFALTNDIDLGGKAWTPIGGEFNAFRGHFDGRGHCVSGLMVKVDKNGADAYAGLFGNAENSILQNLGVRLAEEGVRASTENGIVYAGGIVGRADTVYCCYVEGPGSVEAVASSTGLSFSAQSYAGGIAGYLFFNPVISHCYATVAIKAAGNHENHAGGIVGRVKGNSATNNKLSYTYATGAVEAIGETTANYAGGICGYTSYLTIEHNLALNDSVKGSKDKSNRIVGHLERSTTLTSNFASPDMLVNGSVVSDGAENNENGNPNITFNDLQSKPWNNWTDGWTFPADGYLPQLKLRNGDKDNPTYVDWPATSPQPFIDPVAFLPGKIENTNGGEGSSWNDSILITNRAELAYLAKQVNAGKDLVVGTNNTIKNEDGFQNIYFALSKDIDLSKSFWTPIGTTGNTFNGNFDGRGHCVKGLKVKIDASDKDVRAGLFGSAQFGTLRNLGVHLAKEGIWACSSGHVEAGGLAGRAEQIRNCYVTGEGGVVAQGNSLSSAGGIVGVMSDSLTHCYATVGVKATGTGNNYAGGIAAQGADIKTILAYTYATGTVEAAGGKQNIAGGICGETGGTLSNSLALNGEIKGDDGKSYRIAGHRESRAKLFSNCASTKIRLNASAADSLPIANRINGADTWLETIKKDLIPDDQDSDNGWVAAWEWPQNTTPESPDKFLLPKLKITEGENNNPYYIATSLAGQPDIKADSLLTTSVSSPLILGVHIAEGDSVYLAYDHEKRKWLYTTSGSETPNIPFSNTVKGSGCPVFIVDINSTNPNTIPGLLFDRVNLELNEACLTVNSEVDINLFLIDNVTLANKAGGPAIVNNGKLTIKSNYADASLFVLSPDTAIRNTGTLTLEYKRIHLAGGASTVFNKEGGSTTYHYPMVEWQFDSNLQDKVLEWESIQFKLPQYATGRSFATTYVPAGTPFGLKAGPSDGSSAPVTQQRRDANGSYTTSFTAKDMSLTVYTDVKDCPRIHLLQPEGGNLTIADANGSSLSDGDYVTTGTELTLSCSTETNYYLQNYLFGFAADQQSALSGNTVTVGIGDIWLGASLRYEKPTPPTPPTPPVPVFYSVYLPQVEGATTNPAPGEYKVESWDNFRFKLKIDSAYNESQPVVTTSRGETLQPRSIDGSYLVKYVRSDVEVFIDGLIENNPVANEQIAPADALVPKIWAEGSMLCILPPDASPSLPVGIYTLDGRLFASFTSTPGLIRRPLPTGMYIVRVGETVCKVLIR